jgi:predicted phosphodiesterase
LSSRSREGGGPGLDRLLDLQRDEADRWLADRADVVCVGHSHAPGVEDRPRGRMVNLGDWLLHRTFALVDDDVHLLHWTDGRAVPVEGGMRRRG